MAMGGDQQMVISYMWEVIDNISQTAEEMKARLGDLEKQNLSTKASVDSQNISWMTQVMAVTSVHRGISMLTSSMKELGLLSDKDYQTMMKFNAAVGLVVGAFNLFKGVVRIIQMVQAAEVALASVETYRTVLASPGMIAVVGTALAAAGGVAGYYMGSQGNTNVQQNITYSGWQSPQDRRSSAKDAMIMMGG